MPHLDASALMRDPAGLAWLAGVLRQAGAPWRAPAWRCPTRLAGVRICVALAQDGTPVDAASEERVPRRLARRVAERLPAGLRTGGLLLIR